MPYRFIRDENGFLTQEFYEEPDTTIPQPKKQPVNQEPEVIEEWEEEIEEVKPKPSKRK